jgi:CheY-like chemotaxis protein
MLAGGVAHDFNNILAGIIGHTSYLKTILASASGSADSLRSIEDGAKKASLIIQQILNFSRLELVEVAVACDLGLVAQRTVALLRAAINPDIAIKLELPNDPVFVLGVEAKIAQVIVNLVVNARDAIVGEGRITVRVDVGQSKSSTREMGLIQVIDSGEGMSPETLKRAFEPYFSTKRDRGTGLGLATVHTIIEQCNGEIDVSSSLGNGTTFTIYFPLKGAQLDDRSDDQDMVRAAQEGAPLRSLSHEKILIVDDESPVRQVLSLSLQHLGYSVEVAQSGIEAIDRMEKRGERFDLVILDMLMPQLSGEEVFFRLQALQPDLRALIISGYSSEEAVENILVHGGKGFLQKPFTMSELSHKVRECLE